MGRPVCLFTGQWADLGLDELAAKARAFGYDGLELACWGDHFDVRRALAEPDYVGAQWERLQRHGLGCFAISNHLVGQAICDPVDERHRSILPAHVWGDGEPEGVRRRAADELIATAKAAKLFFDAAPKAVREQLAARASGGGPHYVVNGFTGSSIWHLLYAFPPLGPDRIDAGYRDFAARFRPILDAFQEAGVGFALEVHPTEIAFDIATTRRAIAAVDGHPAFGFNFDPSHLCYQNVDAVAFVREFGARILNVHVKDVWWSSAPTPIGVFGGHAPFGAAGRAWDFRSPGRGRIDFESLIRALGDVEYRGPLTVEWEDPHMDREAGAAEAAAFVRRLDFPRAGQAFDRAFAR